MTMLGNNEWLGIPRPELTLTTVAHASGNVAVASAILASPSIFDMFNSANKIVGPVETMAPVIVAYGPATGAEVASLTRLRAAA